MRFDAARPSRDTYLGAAAATLAVAYLLGVAADVSNLAFDRISFLGSALSEAGWLLQVCGRALLVAGFAVMAVAFIGKGDVRVPRLRLGALVLASGYAVILVGGVLSLFSYHPANFQSSMVIQVAAYLPASAAFLLVATAFGRLRAVPGTETAARNRRLGWASIGFGVEFALLLLSRLVPGSSLSATFDRWDAAYVAALAAAVVAAVGVFGAAHAYRLPSPSSLAHREGVLAIAATLFLLYRVLGLTNLMEIGTWLWRLEAVAFAVAALCAVIGFALSRRSLLGRDRP
jgi:hypothetical protein